MAEDETEYLCPEQRARKHIADETVRTAHPRARLAVEIADDLIAYPILSVADAERRYGRSNPSNRNAVRASSTWASWSGTTRGATTACTGARVSSRRLSDEAG